MMKHLVSSILATALIAAPVVASAKTSHKTSTSQMQAKHKHKHHKHHK